MMMFLRCWCALLVVLIVVTLFVNGDEFSAEKNGDRKDVAAGRKMREDSGIDQWRAVQHQPLDMSGWIASDLNPDDPQPRRRLRKRKRRPQGNPENTPEAETYTRPRRRRPIRLDEARDTWKELEAETPKRNYHRRRVSPVYLPDTPSTGLGPEITEHMRRKEEQTNENKKRLEGNERRRRPIDYEQKSEITTENERRTADVQTRNNAGAVRRKRLRTTTTSTTTVPPASVVDIKNLIKQNSGMSLSEILQKRNLSLSDLLKGKQQAISALSNSGAQSSQKHLETKLFENEKTETTDEIKYTSRINENKKLPQENESGKSESDYRMEDKDKIRRVVMDVMIKHGSSKAEVVKDTPDYEEVIVDWRQTKDKPKTNDWESENEHTDLKDSAEEIDSIKGQDDWRQNKKQKLNPGEIEQENHPRRQNVESKLKPKVVAQEEPSGMKTEETNAKGENDAPFKVMLDWGYFANEDDQERQHDRPVMLKDDSSANWKYGEEDNIEEYLLMNDESASKPIIPKWKQTDSRKPIQHGYQNHDYKRPAEDGHTKPDSRKPSEDGHTTRPSEDGYTKQDSRRPVDDRDAKRPIEDSYTKQDSRRPVENGDAKRPIEGGYTKLGSRRPIEDGYPKYEDVYTKHDPRRPIEDGNAERPIEDSYLKQGPRRPIEDGYAKQNSKRPIEVEQNSKRSVEDGHIKHDLMGPIEDEKTKQDSIRPTQHIYSKQVLRRPVKQTTKVVLNWGQPASPNEKPAKVMLNWEDFIETEVSGKIMPDWKQNEKNSEDFRLNPELSVWKVEDSKLNPDVNVWREQPENDNSTVEYAQNNQKNSTIKYTKDHSKQQENVFGSTEKFNKEQSKQQEKVFDSTLKYAKDHTTYQPKQQEKAFDSMNEADFDKDILEAQRKRIAMLYKSSAHKIHSDVTTESTDKRIFVPSHPKYYTSLNYKPDFQIDSILKTTTMETPTSTKNSGKPKLPVTSAKIIKSSKGKTSTIPPKAIKISLSELLANRENAGPLKMLFDLEEIVSNTVIPLDPTSTSSPEFESTTMMQEKNHAVSAKDEIMEILKDESTKENLKKILEIRNMTVDELVEQRERGSSQRHLADIFHNKTKEPEPTMEHVAEIKVVRKGKHFQPISEIKDNAQELSPITKHIFEINEKTMQQHISEMNKKTLQQHIAGFNEKTAQQEISDVSMSSEELITSERIPGTSFPTYKIENKHKQNPIPIWKTIYNTKEKQLPILEEIENTISEAVNEELTKDKDPANDYDEYVQLPLGVKSAIFASLAIIAISLVVFLTILIIFKWAQQQKQRLCYPGTFKSPILQSESRKSLRTFVSETLGRKKSVYTSRLQSMSDSWDSDKPYQ